MTKTRIGKAVVAAALGILLGGGGIFGQNLTLKVQAQAAPSILDLSVIPSGSGVSAKCEFEGYEPDGGYSMELYLNRVHEDGAVAEIALKGIFAPDGGAGMEITEDKQVEPGVYKATLVLDRTDGGMPAVDNFRNSPLYDVIRNGDSYMVLPHQEPDHRPERPQEPAGEERDDSGQCSCSHSTVSYRVVEKANPEKDAVQVGECDNCGEVLSYSFVPNSAYAAFLEAVIQTIQETQSGEAVIETERWISFNRTVLEEIAGKPQTALTIRYRYDGKRYEVTIPPGAEVNELADENGFCGFRYLDQVFGGKESAE